VKLVRQQRGQRRSAGNSNAELLPTSPPLLSNEIDVGLVLAGTHHLRHSLNLDQSVFCDATTTKLICLCELLTF
jgi:hypothetical protein